MADPMALFEQFGIPGSGLPMPAMITATQVRTKAKKWSSKIFEHWTLLNTIIERYELTIQKRWMKKTQEQRRKILLAAWPNMNGSHRPDIQAFKSRTGPANRNANRDAYMWPEINLEDLLKSKLLLLFLNARGRNKPAAFARADIDLCRFGHTTQVLVPDFLNEYVMMFTGRDSPEKYGELIAWDDHPDAFNWLHTQYGHHPGEGLEILEIQERIYKFLVECCKAILHDMQAGQLTDTTVPIEPEPPSVSSNETGLPSLAVAAAEAPYRLPANLDLTRLESIVGAQLSAAKDHVWTLREDPGYYADTILDWKEHPQELIPDTSGRQHPVFDPARESVFWSRVIGSVCVTAMTAVDIWGSLYDQIVDLQRLSEKYAGKISQEDTLPEDYAFAFYRLRHHLTKFSNGPIGLLKMGFVASPPLRGYYERQPPLSSTTPKTAVSDKPGRLRDESLKSLQWCMMTLFDEQQLHLVGLDTVMDELEGLSRNDPVAKGYISSWVSNQVSELSIISQCLVQINLFLPWAATFENEMALNQKELDQDYLNTQKEFQSYFACSYSGNTVTLGKPLADRFKYPINKTRTQNTTNAMRSAEENLDAFWSAVDVEMSSKNALSVRLRQLLANRVLQRTEEWVAPKDRPVFHSDGQQIDDVLTKPMSNLHLQLHKPSTSQEKHSETAKKAKLKTRGTARPIGNTPDADPTDDSEPDAQSVFKVDKRALKVFNTIFFVPSTTHQPGEIAWGDFLHALCSTGFTAEQGYGSVWLFTPTKLDIDTPISIHAPHPGGKIPFVVARRHGRRLNRTYGWHVGMFVLE